jgi:hypothetical protein
MHYKYRWLYAAFIVLLISGVGFYWVIYPEHRQVTAQSTHIQQLNLELMTPTDIPEVSKPQQSSKMVEHKELSALAHLTQYSQLAGLTIHTMQRLSDPNQLLFHLIAEGRFAQVATFVSAIELSRSFTVLNFSCKLTRQDKIKFDGSIAVHELAAVTPTVKAAALSFGSNPFCMSERVTTLQADSELPLSKSITQMKMIGSLQQGAHVLALIMLPNQKVFTVVVGSVIGVEHGFVSAIHKNQVVVALPKQAQATIDM